MATTYKCIGECGNEFKIGEWECAPGIKHKVAERTFYIYDAPTLDKADINGVAFKSARTSIENCPPERTVKDASTGELTKVPGGNVLFVRGMAIVDDPEKIYWLDKFGHGKNTKEEWFRVYHTPLEKQHMKEIDLSNREREIVRREAEHNDLLERTKAQAQAPKVKAS